MAIRAPARARAGSGQPAVGETVTDIEEWLGGFERRHAFVVLGPDPAGGLDARRVVLLHPPELTGAAEALATSSDFGLPWRESGASPVAWETLDRQRGQSAWREHWHVTGYRSFVRVEIPLPAERAFECFLFSEEELRDTDQAARLAWSIMGHWPVVRQEIQFTQSPLNERERECLSLAFQGFTASETAERMQIPERRVNSTYQQAMDKLQAPNKVAAIQRACWLGAI